jgi:ABC-2 type transport system ATP-binding protein
VADSVALIHDGRIVLSATLEEIQQTHRRLTLRFDSFQDRPPRLPGALSCAGGGLEWTYTCHGEIPQLHSAAHALGASIVEEAALSLDEVFVARVHPRREPLPKIGLPTAFEVAVAASANQHAGEPPD